MHRCVARGTFVAATLAVAFACTPAAAVAQSHRNFPPNALRGELAVTAPPEALLNGKPARLAPGARIRGDDNLLKMSGALAGGKFVVHYTTEATSGMLLDVWILNAAELANKRWPINEREAREWLFDPVGQTWSKP
jgi:hypothetical protein